MKKTYKISGMHCAACSSGLEKLMAKQNGVSEVSVNLTTEKMVIRFDESIIDCYRILALVDKMGFSAEEYSAADSADKRAEAEARRESEIKAMLCSVRLCLLFAVPLLYVSMGRMLGAPLPRAVSPELSPLAYAVLQLLLTMPIVIGGREFYRSGFLGLVKGHPNMDTLVAVGTAAAMLYGIYALIHIALGEVSYVGSLFFESAGVVISLVLLGKYLERRAQGRTTAAIKALTSLAPESAIVVKNGEMLSIPADELMEGDTVCVLPGGRFPCDGVVTEGVSSADVSMLTGESVPVPIGVGSAVTGGSINAEGRILFRASRVGGDTALSQIVRMVEDAQGKKAPVARIADRAAGVFVPVVMGIALLSALAWAIAGESAETVLNIFVSVLVVACPCSLGLATPTAIMVGSGRGAELGILYKSGEALQSLAEVDTAVLDKTGTVTEGRPRVNAIYAVKGWDESELLSMLAAVEVCSEHPIAKAVCRHAETLGLSVPEVQKTRAIAGLGIEAELEGHKLLAGSERLMRERGIDVRDFEDKAEALLSEGSMLMYFAVDCHCRLLVSAVDTMKPDSREAVKDLHNIVISIIMLTGDNEKAANAIADAAGIGSVISGVLPEGKAAEIERLRADGAKVAMVGDGINDAPALAAANVGIAIGNGTDVAIESADIVLMGEGLTSLPIAVRLSRAVMKNIKQNLFWAFFYNTLGIPFAAGLFYAFGGPMLPPMFAGAAMALSSVCVVSNALRLRYFKYS